MFQSTMRLEAMWLPAVATARAKPDPSLFDLSAERVSTTMPAGIRRFGGASFVDLSREEIAELDRAVNGSGGFEDFLRRLQRQINHATATIKLSEKDVSDIPHFAFDFTQGGWENRLITVFGRTLGPKLGRE